ncbi:YbaB/EbfC family nucleoid-associated protein [Amycolatopsis sp. A133]|uniref:YbaB/EbfC family nucleoid-associated protein n=1 Tax=Amycolatopsis sp. A133 TaxID=3064472 RepID=UPI0027FEF67F|nr:YbaB/EbfC family nucleoid-associated protein [Amycolatopsis sp. A133]MDQ7810027.1 YbaB/EbfC family nucleoid-associated protein [Amycolatopsis sp. A133]
MSNPEQLLASFDAKLVEAKQRGERMQAEMAAVSVAERSPDGQIAVEVNHLGNLVGLEIGPAVREKANLAGEILRTVQRAQSKLAEAVQTGVPSIAGTETMNELVQQLHHEFPEPEPQGFVDGGDAAPASDGARFIAEEETPPSPPKPKPAPPRPAPEAGTDDDYFGDGDYLR